MPTKSVSDILVPTFCIGVFCAAMALASQLNIWVGTGVAGLLSMVAVWADPHPQKFRWAIPRPIHSLVFGSGLGILMSVATWLLYPLAVQLLPAIEPEVAMLYDRLRQPPGPLLALPVLLLVVTAEEVVWRGVIIERLSTRFNPWISMVLSACLYVLPQFAFGSPLLIVIALLCGLTWGAMRVYSGTIWAPLLAHILWDLLVFIVFPVSA